MNKKEYSQPKARIAKVFSQEVICDTSTVPSGGETPPRAKEDLRSDELFWNEF